MVQNFPTGMKGLLQIVVHNFRMISRKNTVEFYLLSNRNFREFWLNGKHPSCPLRRRHGWVMHKASGIFMLKIINYIPLINRV